ncbi:MAG: hypothetical protein ACIWVG_17370, partial [Gloeotrichia echinulata HAB0833]
MKIDSYFVDFSLSDALFYNYLEVSRYFQFCMTTLSLSSGEAITTPRLSSASTFSAPPTSALPPSAFSSPTRHEGLFARLLNNRPLKSKIMMIVLPLIAIALYGVGFEMWSAYQHYQRAEELDRANRASDYILNAVGLQAKERGFTATVLTNPQDKTTLGSIA